MKKTTRNYINKIPHSYNDVIINKCFNRNIGLTKYGIGEHCRKSGISLSKLQSVNKILQDTDLNRLLNADIVWDEIVKITYKGVEDTYDIEVPDYHNFIANDIVSHNSTFLLYTAEKALMAGNNVVFISLEMTENQVIRRKWESLTCRPRTDQEITLPMFIDIPIDRQVDGKKYNIKNDIVFRKGIPTDIDEIKEMQNGATKYIKDGGLRLITLPARSVTVNDIQTHLSNLELYENFVPDVIIIDYADLIASSMKGEFRHQLDDIWANLRKLAVERNCCVVTVSQSNRGSANTDLSEESIAEDIRKIAHVTKMIGINQSKFEQKQQIYRLSVLAQREGKLIRDYVMCLSCLDIAKPVLDSRLADEVEYDKGDNKNKDNKQKQIKDSCGQTL